MEYLFRHAFIRDAAYHSLLKADRRVLHAHTALVLEQLLGGARRHELAPLLAHHFEQARNYPQAAHYLLQAGDEARARLAYVEAIAA